MKTGRPPRNLFNLYRDYNEIPVLKRATASECAEFLGLQDSKAFYNLYLHSTTGIVHGCYVEQERIEQSEEADAIQKWDELTEPLRKKYGIKKYQER